MECIWHSERRCVGRGAALGAVLFLASTAQLSLAGCRRKTSAPLPAAVSSAPTRPREVLAELVLAEPRALWPRLTEVLGPVGRGLPQAPELALAAFLGVPALSANSFDFRSPLVMSWVAADAPGLVIGVHLESGPELVAKLTTGVAPTHRVERRGPLSLVFSLADAGRFAFAICGDSVLVGPRTTVERVGEYVARGLAPKAQARAPISLYAPGEALRAFGGPALRAAWTARRAELLAALTREQVQRGRPADFAEPQALLAWLDEWMQMLIAVVESARELRGDLSVAGESVALELELEPEPAGAGQAFAQSLQGGDAAALGALPAETAVGVLLRRGASEPPNRTTLARALFGSRPSERDQLSLERAFSDIDAGRGDVQAFALLADLSVVWRGGVNDATRLRAGIAALLPLLTRKPWSEALTAAFGRPTLVQQPVENMDDATLQRTRLSLAKAGVAAPKTYELASLVSARRFVMTFSSAGTSLLDRALAAEVGGAGLAGQPSLAPLIADRHDVSYAAVADFSRLGLAAPGSPAALGADFGARDGALCLSLRADAAALRALLSRGFAP